MVVTAGATAVGGGDFTVCVLSLILRLVTSPVLWLMLVLVLVLLLVLRDVESVTIGFGFAEGVRVIDLARGIAGYRSAFERQTRCALPLGLPRTGRQVHARGCQRRARLVALAGVEPSGCPGVFLQHDRIGQGTDPVDVDRDRIPGLKPHGGI